MKLIYLIFILLATTCSSTSGSQNDIDELLKSAKDIYFENQTFDAIFDLTEIMQANKISNVTSQITINSSITFINCTFKGDLLAYSAKEDGTVVLSIFTNNVSFIGCTFEKTVSFRASSIMGRANFSNSFFNEKVSFEECTFFQKANFSDCVFHNDARFQNSFFMQNVNFSRAEFEHTAYFQSATFNSEAQFSVSKFIGYADFSLISCRQNFFANYAEFADRAIFNNSYFYGRIDFLQVSFKICEFKKCYFNGEFRFNESTVSKSINFDGSVFWPEKPDLSIFEKD